MDSYLDIAHKVLRVARRPMTATGILNAAYKAGIVPMHLFGQRQHKTLQARLSEDILRRKNHSLFFRTEPGHFFLCEFLSDPNIEEKYKEPFSARRRTRDLNKEPVLSFSTSFIDSERLNSTSSWPSLIERANKSDAIHYTENIEISSIYVPVWTFSMVKREGKVLSYRIGRYRDDRDTFANKRTIGFPGLVSVTDRTLFAQDDYGVSENALNVVLADLDLSLNAFSEIEQILSPTPKIVIPVEGIDNFRSIILVMEWDCPAWFEPTTRRLSLNDPCWIDITVKPNNLDDFEPWSIATIDALLTSELSS